VVFSVCCDVSTELRILSQENLNEIRPVYVMAESIKAGSALYTNSAFVLKCYRQIDDTYILSLRIYLLMTYVSLAAHDYSFIGRKGKACNREAHLCCEAQSRGEGIRPEEHSVPICREGTTGNAIMFIQGLSMQ
jgi:hypothetical protein